LGRSGDDSQQTGEPGARASATIFVRFVDSTLVKMERPTT
jgi:hypothetical protein